MFIFIALGPGCDCGVRHALPASGCLLSLSLLHTLVCGYLGLLLLGTECLGFGFGFLGRGFFCVFFFFFSFNLHKPLEGIIFVSELNFCHADASSDSLFYAVSNKSGIPAVQLFLNISTST